MINVEGRPSWDETFLAMAAVIARRSACCKRQVGAVLVRENHVISVGYNGPPKGAPPRDTTTCVRIGVKSGEQPDKVCCTHAGIAFAVDDADDARIDHDASAAGARRRRDVERGALRRVAVVGSEGDGVRLDDDAASVFAASGVVVDALPALEPLPPTIHPWPNRAVAPSDVPVDFLPAPFVISCPHPGADWLQVCSCPSQCSCKGTGGMCL